MLLPVLAIALLLLGGLVAGVRLFQTKGQELLAWGVLALAVGAVLLAFRGVPR